MPYDFRSQNLVETVRCGGRSITAILAAMRNDGKKGTTTTGALKLLLNLVVLVAFTLQTFLVQTHLHNLPASLLPAGTATASLPAPKAPFDAEKCFLCQEYTHVGVYLTPAAAAVLPPSAAVSQLPHTLAAFAAARPLSHNWMGRAPPHA
jgi:hypothetical protein